MEEELNTKEPKQKPTRKQWIKCVIALCLYFAFLFWVRSIWGIIIAPLIYDAYITKKIPWTFWKKAKDKTVRTLMSWVDAIVFALIAVYFVNIYVFQNYQIPSSSLEKSLLVGDFLYVSKVSYGPRVPNTPLSMPLTQHTLPIFNCKSYLDWPSWKYKRIAGFGKVKRNDIVVFNFPAGDTVAVKYQQTDFYDDIVYSAGKQLSNPINIDSLNGKDRLLVYQFYYNAGRQYVLAHPEEFGELIYRPVDRRENYVKRCVGIPGDTLQIKNRIIYINGKAQPTPVDAQFRYNINATGTAIPEDFWHDELGLSMEDIQGYQPGSKQFQLPLTAAARIKLAARKDYVTSIQPIALQANHDLFPLNMYTNWTVDNYGPIWIPAKGSTIKLNFDNLPLYERCISVYEGNKLQVKDDGIYINEQKTDHYTFKMDYYWMMGDNRHNSQDSRFWGFVPEDHVVGKPILVWLSLDKDRGWFSGKIRWNRLFKWVE